MTLDPASTPTHARELPINGLRYHVVDVGGGPAVILLHGFPDTSNLWRRQIDALVAAGYRAIAPDLRGRGRTERPPNVADYALPLVARDVAALLTALGVARAHVVGHDWGAAAAWLVAALFPDRVDHLVALSVGFPGATPADAGRAPEGLVPPADPVRGDRRDIVPAGRLVPPARVAPRERRRRSVHRHPV